MHYYRTELEALFFPRGKFFRRCCYESAPHVQFCVARLGNRELLGFSQVFSQLYLTECSFFAENCASQVGDHNFDPAKHQKRSLVAAEAVFLPFYLAESACTARWNPNRFLSVPIEKWKSIEKLWKITHAAFLTRKLPDIRGRIFSPGGRVVSIALYLTMNLTMMNIEN